MKKTAVILAFLSAGLFSCGGNENKHTTSGTSTASTGGDVTETPTATEIPADVSALLEKYTCRNCHKADEKLIGPAYKEVALKGYRDAEIVNLIYNPKPENWPGYPPMLPQKE